MHLKEFFEHEWDILLLYASPALAKIVWEMPSEGPSKPGNLEVDDSTLVGPQKFLFPLKERLFYAGSESSANNKERKGSISSYLHYYERRPHFVRWKSTASMDYHELAFILDNERLEAFGWNEVQDSMARQLNYSDWIIWSHLNSGRLLTNRFSNCSNTITHSVSGRSFIVNFAPHSFILFGTEQAFKTNQYSKDFEHIQCFKYWILVICRMIKFYTNCCILDDILIFTRYQMAYQTSSRMVKYTCDAYINHKSYKSI